MPNIPTPINPPVQTADEILQLLVLEIAFNKIVAAIAGGLPVLQLPIISTIYSFLMAKLANFFYVPLEELIAHGIISLQVKQQDTDYTKAKEDLHKAQQSGDSNAAELAKQKAKDALRKLIHFDGQ